LLRRLWWLELLLLESTRTLGMLRTWQQGLNFLLISRIGMISLRQVGMRSLVLLLVILIVGLICWGDLRMGEMLWLRLQRRSRLVKLQLVVRLLHLGRGLW